MPRAVVIPVLAYPDVTEAAAWLCDAFGFNIRLRIGSHRVQLNVWDGGAVTIREMRQADVSAVLGLGCSITVRVEGIDAHYAHAKRHGARIIEEPVTYPYGERQYSAIDLAGYAWTFSESVADMHPQDWGGTAENL
jgi:uncharacterized glyoxalase superfamily protein PhnB